MNSQISAKRSSDAIVEDVPKTFKQLVGDITWNNTGDHEKEVLRAFQTRTNATMLDPSRTKSLFGGKTPELFNVHKSTAYPRHFVTNKPIDLDLGQVYLCEQPAGKQKYPDGLAFRFITDTHVRLMYIEAKQDEKDEFRYSCNSILSRPRPQNRHIWVIGKRPFLGTALCSKEQSDQNKAEQKHLVNCQTHIRKMRKTTNGFWADHRAGISTCSVKGFDFDRAGASVEKYLSLFLAREN